MQSNLEYNKNKNPLVAKDIHSSFPNKYVDKNLS